MVEVNQRLFEGVATTPYILLMNGVDHLEAQPDLLPILKQIEARLPGGQRIHQCSLEEYVGKVRAHMQAQAAPPYLHTGEIRTGHDWELLKGTLSSRIYLKQENVRAQTMLESVLEPLYSMLCLGGMEGAYPADTLRYMWKCLLKNHPHDSICGCSRDEVHAHMEDNYWRLRDTADEMLRRGMALAAAHLHPQGATPQDYQLTVANTTEHALTRVVEATLDFPCSEGVAGFAIEHDGAAAPFEVLAHEVVLRDIFSPVNLPGSMEVDRYRVRLLVRGLPPFSFRSYRVRRAGAPVQLPGPAHHKAGPPFVLENGQVRLTVYEDGRAALEDLASGRRIERLAMLEDTADCGDSYVYGRAKDAPVLAGGAAPRVTLLEHTPLLQRVCVAYTLHLPAYYNFEQGRRSRTFTDVPVELVYTLRAGEPWVEIGYTIHNSARDHRLRLIVNTGVETGASVADIPFDIVAHTGADHCFSTMSRVLPNSTFALLENSGGGVAVLTEGQHEYEHLETQQALALTLLRATGVISRNRKGAVTGGLQWDCPANQCLRTLNGRVAVCAYQGNHLDAEIPLRSKQFRAPAPVHFAACDQQKFAGGRTAVQDTRLEELFYPEDPYEAVRLPQDSSLLSAQGRGVLVTALKRAENGSGYILRVVNLAPGTEALHISCSKAVGKVAIDETAREPLSPGQEGMVEMELESKVIASLLLDS